MRRVVVEAGDRASDERQAAAADGRIERREQVAGRLEHDRRLARRPRERVRARRPREVVEADADDHRPPDPPRLAHAGGDALDEPHQDRVHLVGRAA